MNLEADSENESGKQERAKKKTVGECRPQTDLFKMVGTSRSESEIVAVRLQPTVCSEKGTRRVAMPL